MNTQRWIALGALVLIIACVATSQFWIPRLTGQSGSATGTPTATATSQPAPTDATLAGIALTLTPNPTLDPVVASIMEDLQMGDLGIGIQPHIVYSGDFVLIDAVHRGEGTAAIYRFSDTEFVLHLENFSVTPGPEQVVILSQSDAPRTSADTLLPTYVRLGVLKSPTGTQNYVIPPDTILADYHSVVIYDFSLNIVYSTATLTEVRGQ